MKKPKTNPNYMTNHQNIAINRGFSLFIILKYFS